MECVLWIAGGLFTAALTYVGFCAAIMAVLIAPPGVSEAQPIKIFTIFCAPLRGG